MSIAKKFHMLSLPPRFRMTKITMPKVHVTLVLYEENLDEATKYGIGAHLVGFGFMLTALGGTLLAICFNHLFAWTIVIELDFVNFIVPKPMRPSDSN